MKHNHIIKGSVLSLALVLMTTGTKAHDALDCQLGLEFICDEITTDPSDWELCSWLVGEGCVNHGHTLRPGNELDKLMVQIQDREVEHNAMLDFCNSLISLT